MNRIEVAIPVIRCVFTANAIERGPLHPLDVGVLAAIRDGITDAAAIAMEFSIHRNIVDQIIVRLLNEEFISLDFDTDKLQLDGAAIPAAIEGALHSLAFRGPPSRLRFHALQDLKWGHIIPFRLDDSRIRFGVPTDESARIPCSVDHIDSILALGPSSVASLFNSQRWLTCNSGQHWMAQSGDLTGMPESRELLIQFTPFRVADTIEWWPASSDLGRNTCPLWGSLIAQIRKWLQENAHTLKVTTRETHIASLRSQTVRRFVPFTSLSCLEQAKSVKHTTDAADVVEVQQECITTIAARVPVSLVCNAAQHVSACKRILNESQHWCAIHSAFWSEDGIQQLLPEIRAAVAERGVQVYILLGLADNDDKGEIPKCLADLMNELKDSKGDLFVTRIPTHSHAKIVAADDVSLLVSSFNFLAATERNPQLNVGLLFTHGHSQPSSIVADVVRCVTSRPVRDEILSDLEQQTGSYLEATQHASAVFPQPIIDLAVAVAQLQSLLQSGRDPSVVWEIVESAAHRDQLLNALHSASISVVVTSGDLSRSAVDAVFRSYLADAVERGVSVELVWGAQTSDPTQLNESETLARELHNTWSSSGRFHINLVPNLVHAKLLVVDECVSLVSSFNFLSYRGLRHGAHELGVKVFSPAIASQLIRMCRELPSK